MAVSKVILNGETLMDVTQDTVTEGTLLTGQTATGADGVRLTGSVTVPQPSDAAPQMDGTAAAGTSDDYARADHVHPHDTSRLVGVSLATPSDTFLAPVTNGIAWIDIGDGLKVSNPNNRAVLSAKTGTTASTVAAGNHTHSDYQATLVSGTNIKTVNGESLLGNGDLTVGGGSELTLYTDNSFTNLWIDAKRTTGLFESFGYDYHVAKAEMSKFSAIKIWNNSTVYFVSQWKVDTVDDTFDVVVAVKTSVVISNKSYIFLEAKTISL